MYDLAIVGGNLYIEGNFISENLYIKNGKIDYISKKFLESKGTYDAMGKKVLPGFIDPHVHFELGLEKFRSSDDFYSGSVSAAFGGITTIIDFLDPISNAVDLQYALNKRRNLAKKSVIDYAFHVTIANPKHQVINIVNEMNKLNIPSVKLFTTYSESGRRTYDSDIKQLLQISKEKNILVLAHIENDDLIDLRNDYFIADLPISRNYKAELNEALKLAEFTKELDGQMYMVHLSSGKTLKALLEKHKDILNEDFYVESCPHYFNFNSNVYNEESGYLYTMAPPLRSQNEVTLLKDLFNYIDTIGTDHCPFMKSEKKGKKLINTPMGIGSVEHSFNLMYSLFKEEAIDRMTINPAKIHGLYPKKGALVIGADADIVIYDDTKTHTIGQDHSLSDYSIYNGHNVTGDIESTISRGNFIIKNKKFVRGSGQYVR